MYSKIYLRLEPLGLELVAAAIRNAGHEVRLIDLQAENSRDYFRMIDQVATRCHRVLVQLPREHSGDHRPGERHTREASERAHLRTLAGRARHQSSASQKKLGVGS